MAATTRLSAYGGPRAPYGSFAGKAAADAAIVTSSGPARVSAGTSWNPTWATDYGPDADRAKKAKKAEVVRAIVEIKEAERLPAVFNDAKEIARRSRKPGDLAAELMAGDDDSLVRLMTAYYAMRRQEEEELAVLLLVI